MKCQTVYYVQSLEDGRFLRPDGEGGAEPVMLLSDAVPFMNEEAANFAVLDYFDGYAKVIEMDVFLKD